VPEIGDADESWTFLYTVSDGFGGTAQAAVIVIVTH
jgi:hypothetical protein